MCGYDSDSLVHNHTDKLIDLLLAASAMYRDLLHPPPYKNMHFAIKNHHHHHHHHCNFWNAQLAVHSLTHSYQPPDSQVQSNRASCRLLWQLAWRMNVACQ